MSGEIVEIKTKTNEVVTIIPEGQDIRSWSLVSEMPSANEKVKVHSSGKARLGIPRMY